MRGFENLGISENKITKPLNVSIIAIELVSPVSVNDGIESQSIPPGLREVSDLDPGVLVGRLLGPSQQGLLGCQVLLANNNVRDLK